MTIGWRNIGWILTMIMLTATGAFAAAINMVSFPRKPGEADDAPRFIRALTRLNSDQAADTLLLGNATYRFAGKSADTDAALVIENLRNKRIAGENAAFLFSRPDLGGILLRRLVNFQMTGITIDWTPPPFFQGEILEVSALKKTVLLKCHADHWLQAVSFFRHAKIRWATLHRTDGSRIHGISHRVIHIDDFQPLQTTGLIVTLRNRRDFLLPGLKPGNFMVVTARYGRSHAVAMKDCSNVTIEDIAIHASPAIGILVHPGCRNITIQHNRIGPPGTRNRFAGTNADGIHVIDPSGTLVLRANRIDRIQDDAIVVSYRGEKGIVGTAHHRIVIESPHPSVRFLPRRKLMAISPRGALVNPGIIRGTRRLPDRSLAIDVDWTMDPDALVAGPVIFFPLPVEPADIRIERNSILAIRGTGLRINAPNVTAKDNRIVDCTGPSIRMAFFLKGRWMPQYPAVNVIISDNHLEGFALPIARRAGFGMIDIGCMARKSDCSAVGNINENISILRNRFTGAAGFACAAIRVDHAANVSISENSGETGPDTGVQWRTFVARATGVFFRDNINIDESRKLDGKEKGLFSRRPDFLK